MGRIRAERSAPVAGEVLRQPVPILREPRAVPARREDRLASYAYIEKEADLKALAADLLRESEVAFDTEADSFYHYFDKLCLVQVATRRAIYLIDPIALGGAAELWPLAPVFSATRIRKIFHAAEYDLYILKRDLGFRFENLFDTMIAAQLLGYPAVGLAALVDRHFGISLPKAEQRSDWSTRPLRKTQLVYAAADVTYLIELAELLEAELRDRSRSDWAREDFASTLHREWPARSFDTEGYLRIKGARTLAPAQLAALRELYLMRDARARGIDRPPFKVLGNRALFEIAERLPESAAQLGAIKGVSELVLRRLGRDILQAVQRGAAAPHPPLTRLPGGGRRRLDRRAERRLTRLKRWRSSRSRELGLDPGVLCPNALLEEIAARDPRELSALSQLPGLKRWFVREFGGDVVELLGELSS